jgi:DNA-binding transcriptional regulator YiaG
VETGIEKAVKLAGTQAHLATRLGVTQQAVCEWVQRGWVPEGRIDDVLNAVDKDCSSIKPRELLDPKIVRLVDRICG